MALAHEKFYVGQRVRISSSTNEKLVYRVGTISGISEESTTDLAKYIISLDKPLSPPGHFSGISWKSVVISGVCLEEYHGPN